MHVIAHRPQIAITAAVHDQGLVSTAKQVTKELVPPVESSGIGAQEPFHARHQIGLGRLHHHVKVIGHETERMHLPVGFGATLGQGFQKTFPVGGILEYRLPPVAPAHHMINRPLIFQAYFAWHRTEYSQKARSVSIVRTDPFAFACDPFESTRRALSLETGGTPVLRPTQILFHRL